MTRLTLELPEEVAAEVQRRAEGHGVSLSRFVADLVQREVRRGWPERFFEEVVGGWKGEPLERPAQGLLEERDSI
jgi:metal-responsive CopG/Arc/MetJ family transcriptional regulator